MKKLNVIKMKKSGTKNKDLYCERKNSQKELKIARKQARKNKNITLQF